MGKEKRERILFSCLGSTDPVRGLHDGAMLHIARHYRPEKIFWYITKEMRQLDEKDNRYRLSIQWLKKQCPGYEPEILEPYYDESEDASDFDGFYEPFSQQMEKLSREYPDAEILVNLSSGTPQMKMTLAMLLATLQYRVRVVQVKNFERRSGTSDRTTAKNYELAMELELNEDADPSAENRCEEPKLIGIQREKQRTQVKSLLQRYDYEALLYLVGVLPEQVRTIVQHLAYRAAYDMEKAIKQAAHISGINLYPAGNKSDASYKKYEQLSEYLLTLKLMQRTQRYTDFVIRLNPLVIRLQESWLEKKGIKFSALGYQGRSGERVLTRVQVERYDPQLLAALDAKYRGEFRDSALNISLCNCLMEYLGESESDAGKFFLQLERLNSVYRNESAHTLTNVREEQIAKLVGCDSSTLIKNLIHVLEEIYPQHYREELFSIYDTANREILNAL